MAGSRGVMTNFVRNVIFERVQNLDEAVCISHCANILGEDMNPFILPPVISK